MRYSRQHPALPDPFAGIALYADLTQATLTAWHNLVPIKKILRNHKILYKWGFPGQTASGNAQRDALHHITGKGHGASTEMAVTPHE